MAGSPRRCLPSMLRKVRNPPLFRGRAHRSGGRERGAAAEPRESRRCRESQRRVRRGAPRCQERPPRGAVAPVSAAAGRARRGQCGRWRPTAGPAGRCPWCEGNGRANFASRGGRCSERAVRVLELPWMPAGTAGAARGAEGPECRVSPSGHGRRWLRSRLRRGKLGRPAQRERRAPSAECLEPPGAACGSEAQLWASAAERDRRCVARPPARHYCSLHCSGRSLRCKISDRERLRRPEQLYICTLGSGAVYFVWGQMQDSHEW